MFDFQVVEPSTVNMNQEKLQEMDKMIPHLYKNLNGIIVMRQDKVVFENYYNGYSMTDTHHVASVTKSILSALIGIAYEQGYIQSLDQKVLDFFPEYNCPPSEIQKKAITIRHLLTMRAPYVFKPLQEPLEKLVRQKDWINFSLDLLGRKGNIGDFQYSSCGAHILSAILTRVTKKSAREFANENLFPYIGIKEIEDNINQTFDYDGVFGKDLKGWGKDPQGYSIGGWGLKLTTRDMIRFGMLYLHEGFINGKQVLNKEWIHQSIEGMILEDKVKVFFNYYGYLWCIYRKDDCFAYMALGDGGNMICCIPKEDIVVAISSQTMRKPRERWELIENYILPSLAL